MTKTLTVINPTEKEISDQIERTSQLTNLKGDKIVTTRKQAVDHLRKLTLHAAMRKFKEAHLPIGTEFDVSGIKVTVTDNSRHTWTVNVLAADPFGRGLKHMELGTDLVLVRMGYTVVWEDALPTEEVEPPLKLWRWVDEATGYHRSEPYEGAPPQSAIDRAKEHGAVPKYYEAHHVL